MLSVWSLTYVFSLSLRSEDSLIVTGRLSISCTYCAGLSINWPPLESSRAHHGPHPDSHMSNESINQSWQPDCGFGFSALMMGDFRCINFIALFSSTSAALVGFRCASLSITDGSAFILWFEARVQTLPC